MIMCMRPSRRQKSQINDGSLGGTPEKKLLLKGGRTMGSFCDPNWELQVVYL